MRRNRSFFVTESSRNDPETVFAPPHRVLLSPYRTSHYDPGCRLGRADGNWGCVIEDRVEYGSVVVAFRRSLRGSHARRWHCVRRQSSHRFSGFGKAAPRRRAARSRASRRPSCRHHHSHHHRHIAHIAAAGCRAQSLRADRAPATRRRRRRQMQARTRRCRRIAAHRAGARRGADAGAACRRSGQRRTHACRPRFGGSSDVVAEARRYLGGNPTGRGSLWCARFMNMVLERSGHRGTGSDMARSFASYGQRVSGPQVGAIAVMGTARRRPCRRGQRHRCPGQSDRGVRQQRQPGQGSAGLARPDLRLRDAELRQANEWWARPRGLCLPYNSVGCFRRDRIADGDACRRRSPRHRCRIRCGRAGASAPAGCRGRARRCPDRH